MFRRIDLLCQKTVSKMSYEAPITRHALGEQIELGTLFDATTGQFYSSLSLWNHKDIESQQIITDAHDIKLKVSSTVEELRNNSDLDANGALDIAFGFVKLNGSAKYLSSSKNTTNEARIDVTCIKKNRVRSIPMETMIEMPHQNLVLRNPNITHFVCEVTEGATANISFRKKCSNNDEIKEIGGKMSGELKKIVSGVKISGGVTHTTGDTKNIDEYTIEVDGVVDVPISSFEDVAKAARDMPETLKRYNNTLTVKLLPISLVYTDENRIVRSLDEKTISRLANTLDKTTKSLASLEDLQKLCCIRTINSCKKQCENFQGKYGSCLEEFKEKVREILPKLRSGTQEETSLLISEINKSTSVVKKQHHVAESFISAKTKENHFLQKVFEQLENEGFQNFETDSDNDLSNRVFLDISCNELLQKRHAMESKLKIESIDDAVNTDSDAESDSDDNVTEWFENGESAEALQKSITEISKLRSSIEMPEVSFGFGVTKKKKEANKPGQISLVSSLGTSIIPVELPKPIIETTVASETTIKVSWTNLDHNYLTGFQIQWRSKMSSSSAGPRSQEHDDRPWDIENLEPTKTDFEISSYQTSPLKSGRFYETRIAAKYKLLGLVFCSPVESETKTGPLFSRATTAEKLIEFFEEENSSLSHDSRQYSFNNWKVEGCNLYLGLKPTETKFHSLTVFDIACEFQPEVVASPVGGDNAIMLIFLGEGPTVEAEMNAYISFLLGASLKNRYLFRVADSFPRNTIFRLKPLSDLFEGKTMYFVTSLENYMLFQLQIYKLYAYSKCSSIIKCFDESDELRDNEKSFFKNATILFRNAGQKHMAIINRQNNSKTDTVYNFIENDLELKGNKQVLETMNYHHHPAFEKSELITEDDIEKWDASMACQRKMHAIVMNCT